MSNLFTISAAFLALAAFMNSASAQVIPVGNFSFESPTTSGYTVEKSIPDWAFTVAGTNPTGVETLVSAYGNTGSSQGVNYAFLNIPSGTADLIYTGTGANALPDIVAGENYTLTVALGNRTEGYPSQPDGTAGNDTLNLQVGGTTYATVSVNETELPLNTFTDESITLTAATISADGLVGQLTVVMGVLAAQIVNLLIARPVADGATWEAIQNSWNGQYAWRWMFTAVSVPSLIFLIGTLFLPESPRWLVKNGTPEPARDILARIGGKDYASGEIRDIQETLGREEIKHVRFSDLLEPRILRLLLIGCFLAVLQQWSGINVIFNYAEEIFHAAGYGISSILFNIVITGLVMLIFTLIAIQTVDKFGRRILMLTGCAGIALSHALIGLGYWFNLKGLLVVIPVMTAIAFYSFSLAPVTWVLISEIFPNRIRGAAISVSVSALWIACFILTYTFPLLNSALGPALTFWLYAVICFAGTLFIFKFVPETKGRSLEQIERHS